ncbi:MAG TPA: sulfotransferase domain-containing protein [Rhizomicrobium sp.]|nr:sulfotransferase domain-containing protein [Rhizomicrobium sp.]
MSSIHDFVTGPARPASLAALAQQPALPCVIDTARARTLYLPGLDAQKLREAPFVNLHARKEARLLLSVPWEAGPINRPRVETDPIYVFSPGRCGSTLLHKLLMAANIQSVSEPDIGGALISPAYQKYPLIRPVLRWATRIYARDLMSALGSNHEILVIKLRSQYCRVAPLLLKNAREKRTIFMTRGFESWAQSVARLFKVTPTYLVREYRRSLECYAYLRRRGNCHFLRYESLIEQPHREMAQLAGFLGREISVRAIEDAMAVGSQEGTRLDRVSERGLARWDAIKDETSRLWFSSGTAALCDQIIGAGES